MVVTALFVCGQQCTKLSHLAKKSNCQLSADHTLKTWLSYIYYHGYQHSFFQGSSVSLMFRSITAIAIYADALMIFPKHDFRMIILPFYFSQRNL